MVHPDLILGVDGGGTSTVAWLADKRLDGEAAILGRGCGGPSNPHMAGSTVVTDNLDIAIEAAFLDAGEPRQQVAAACLGLAGAGRESQHRGLLAWAGECELAVEVEIVNDAIPLLYAASPAGTGLGLISGTGSFAFCRTDKGQVSRCGGWGPLLGDGGSGYAVSVAGLQAATRGADGRGPQTALLDNILGQLQLGEPLQLIDWVQHQQTDRKAIAALAPVVVQASLAGDEIAAEIIGQAVEDLADLVVTVAAALEDTPGAPLLAVTGGFLLGDDGILDQLVAALGNRELALERIVTVQQPVTGAIVRAAQLADCQPQ